MNTYGNILKITSFGESHGPAIGGVIDGFPSGIKIDMDFIQSELDRRKPGQSALTTPRKENDKVQILSGVFDGLTTGSPIGFLIENSNQHSSDYDNLKNVFRPSHADYTYFEKYGIRDHRGGGRSSARETAVRCVAGAFAKLVLKQLGIQITAYTSQVGNIKMTTEPLVSDFKNIEQTPVRCPHLETAQAMIQLIETIKSKGDTIGGIISCLIQGVPAGLGEPIYGKLHAALGNAMLSINAVKGFEYGDGFDVSRTGSEVNDQFIKKNNQISTRSNHSGGIQGGISNGQDIYFKVAFKPVATVLQEQNSVDTEGNEISLKAKGRHDPCVLPRAVPVVEAMAAITILDYYLLSRASGKLFI